MRKGVETDLGEAPDNAPDRSVLSGGFCPVLGCSLFELARARQRRVVHRTNVPGVHRTCPVTRPVCPVANPSHGAELSEHRTEHRTGKFCPVRSVRWKEALCLSGSRARKRTGHLSGALSSVRCVAGRSRWSFEENSPDVCPVQDCFVRCNVNG